ncbi:MAG: DUF4252 domain-containing protein [Wenzhouxiangellaceae bacterium]|nr:DUF4252 domain-containing protein [Wenzhouxiangellaceae bacterium]
MNRFTQAVFAVLTALMLLPPAVAQTQIAGQVDLAPIAADIGKSPKVNLNFGSAMVRAFAETIRSSNAEAAGILDTVAGIRVMVYEDVDGAAIRGRVLEMTGDLGQRGWTPTMEVRDDDAHVDLYLRESEQFIDGLVLMLTESDGAAVFINVFGTLDPVVIGKLIGGGQGLKGLDLEALAGQFMPDGNGAGTDDDS